MARTTTNSYRQLAEYLRDQLTEPVTRPELVQHIERNKNFPHGLKLSRGTIYRLLNDEVALGMNNIATSQTYNTKRYFYHKDARKAAYSTLKKNIDIDLAIDSTTEQIQNAVTPVMVDAVATYEKRLADIKAESDKYFELNDSERMILESYRKFYNAYDTGKRKDFEEILTKKEPVSLAKFKASIDQVTVDNIESIAWQIAARGITE